MGHLIPLTELANQLVLRHRLSVTFIIPTATDTPLKPQRDLLDALPDTITSIFLPPVNLDDLPADDGAIETRIALTLTRSFPALHEALAELTHESSRNRPSALLVDIFGPPSFELAKKFSLQTYIFSPVSAMTLVSIFHIPLLDEKFGCEYRDLPEPVELPGCVPVHGRDLPDPVQDRTAELYGKILQLCKMFSLADGILLNSFVDLEPGAIRALEEGEWCKPDIYPVGPLVRTGSERGDGDGSECLKWLDKHPHGSVLFVSFGSGGTLCQEQLMELAFGLEESGQRFLWVVKSPNGKSNGAYFNTQNIHDPSHFLPDGFVGRVKDRSLVVSSWAPQVEILSHNAIGGFLTHCGWNSISESIVNGVPMIAWPLYAEQRMNAVSLADDLRVAWRVRVNENGVVGRKEIGKYVRSLIEGEDGGEIRKKIKEVKDLSLKAWGQDGSSTRSLSLIAQKWVN